MMAIIFRGVGESREYWDGENWQNLRSAAAAFPSVEDAIAHAAERSLSGWSVVPIEGAIDK